MHLAAFVDDAHRRLVHRNIQSKRWLRESGQGR